VSLVKRISHRTTRVYAAADIHGKKDRIERVRNNVASLKADLLVLAGDITNFISPLDVLLRVNDLALPVLLVRGNSDFRRVDDLCRFCANCIDLNGVRTRIRSIPFVGLSGTLPIPFHSRITLNENSCLKKIAPLVNSDTVFVTHTPPRGSQDLVVGRFHAGSSGLLKLVKRRQPPVVICAHIHESSGVTTVGKTTVVNCAMSKKRSGALLIFEDGKLARLEMI